MKYSVNELIKKEYEIQEKIDRIKKEIGTYSTFNCATIEKIEDTKPNYDIINALKEIDFLNNEIVKIKHAISKFNLEYVVEKLDLTIDQILIKLPMLNNKKKMLYGLASKQEKVRYSFASNVSYIDYEYTNYNVEEVRNMLGEVQKEVTKMQLELDIVNTQQLIELDI